MKKYLPWLLLVPLLCLGAAQVNKITLFTDWPNSTPVSSDFLLFQRNGTFFSSAQSQFLPTWFNNPVFTGNGSINGAFNVGGTLTVGGAVITGVTYFGDGSGLSNVASQVYLKNINDNGTNETFWSSIFNGISTFQEIDAQTAYFTNYFTFLTNSQYLATDGNGKVIKGPGLPATNVLLSAGDNVVFTTNLDGTIVIAGSATNVTTVTTNNTFVNTNVFISTSNSFFNNTYITNLYTVNNTNNTFVNTNLFISISNAYFTNNTFINTNFSTNLFFVSGKGNTVVITNVFVAEQGLLVNSNTAVSSAVITDAKHAYTNAVNAHGVFTNSATGPPSFGLLQNTELVNSSITVQGSAVALGGSTLAAGASVTFNLWPSTNLPIAGLVSPTNGVSSASAVDFSVPEATTNIAGAVSFTSLSNFNTTNYNHAIRYIINRSGSDQTITVGSWETDSARQTATTYIATNNTTLALMFSAQINVFTNVTAYKTFR